MCVTRHPGDSEARFDEQPCLIVEVLSNSTRRIDLGEKRRAYAAIAGVQTYLAVESRRAEVRLYRASQGWTEEIYAGQDARIPMRCAPDPMDVMLDARELGPVDI